MNQVGLVGRLTRDPELRYTAAGVPVTQFTLAVDDTYSKEKKADFLNIVAWKQLAETCANYLKKGRLCSVEGRISTRNYDHKDGYKVYVTEIIASRVQFLESNKEGAQNIERQEPQSQIQPDNGQVIDISDDDLPF